MKNIIKIMFVGLSVLSANVFAATIDGSLLVGGAYTATGGANLSDATTINFGTVFGNAGTGDVAGTIDIFTPAGTGGSISLTAFAPVANAFSVGGWTFDLSSLSIIDQTAGVLNLTGTGVLSGNGFDATPASWSFSSQSLTSYSMMVTTVVPVPAAAWLFGTGLIGLVGVARRKA